MSEDMKEKVSLLDRVTAFIFMVFIIFMIFVFCGALLVTIFPILKPVMFIGICILMGMLLAGFVMGGAVVLYENGFFGWFKGLVKVMKGKKEL